MMIKFLGWLQERIKHWTKPASSVLIIGTLSDLTRSHAELMVENAMPNWTEKNYRLTKFLLKPQKSLTDEASSQHRGDVKFRG